MPAASTCNLTVTFTPTAIGSLSGTISISDNSLGSPHIINLSGVGSGSVAGFAPGSLTFSAMAVGTTSAPQTVSLTNSGNATMNINSIGLSGDYSETNNCGASVGAGSSCQIQITFTPTATGLRNGVLTVADDALNNPQIFKITGTGQAAATGIGLSASSLSFAGQILDSASASQVIRITNNESSSVTVSNVTVTSAFSQTNNCSVLAPNGGTCSVTIAFAPSASGPSSGTLTISDSAGTQTVGLTGIGLDFSLASSTMTETIQDGSTATYTVTVSPVGGSFTNAIQLNCSGLPAGATCSFSQNSPTPNANPVNVTLRIATTTSVAQASPNQFLKGFTNLALWIPFQGLGLFGIVFVGWTKQSRKTAVRALLGLIVVSLIFMCACAGGLGVTSSNQTGSTSTSYKIKVNGTSGKLQHSVPLTLNVQQS